MFDFDAEISTPTWQDAEWDDITKNHAEREHDASRDAAIKNQGKREAFANFYEGRHSHRKERIAVDCSRYACLALGLTVLGYAVRSITWLGITLGIVALIFGLIAAYGAGKYSEM